MSEQQRQQVSALVDGETDPASTHVTVAALEANAGLKGEWERYHLIGSVLRGEPIRPECRDIAAGVRARLASEPVPLVPRAARRERESRFSPFIGAALAASAAFFAVFAVPQLFEPERRAIAPVETLAVADMPPQFKLAEPGQRWHLEEPGLQNKLDRFLVNHQANSPSSSFKGFLPYATVVGYESGR